MMGNRMAWWVVAQFRAPVLRLDTALEVDLYKNPGDADDSPVFLSSRDSSSYLTNATGQRSELNQ